MTAECGLDTALRQLAGAANGAADLAGQVTGTSLGQAAAGVYDSLLAAVGNIADFLLSGAPAGDLAVAVALLASALLQDRAAFESLRDLDRATAAACERMAEAARGEAPVVPRSRSPRPASRRSGPVQLTAVSA